MTRILSLLIGLCLALPLFAQETGTRRLTDRDDLYGWEAIGKLTMKGGGFCTGTLIARDLVLTAAHCVLDRATDAPYRPEDILFRAGYSEGNALAERRAIQIAAHPDFTFKRRLSDDLVRVDVALIRLESPIPLDVADPFALYSGDPKNTEVSVSSYGRGRSEAIQRQRSCRVLDRRNGIISFDCDVTFGSSGSALLAKSGSRWQILSVVSAVGTRGGRKTGYGMDLGENLALVKRLLRRDAPKPKAGIRRLQVGGARSGSSGAKFVRPNGS